MNKKFFMVALAAVALMMGFSACSDNDDKKKDDGKDHTSYVLNKFADQPYLAEVWWGNDYDPEYAAQVIKKQYNQTSEAGGCSSWRKDNFHGRNIDWMMRDYATLIIHLPKSDKVKHASVRVVTGKEDLRKDFLDNNKNIPEDLRKSLPAGAVDGINDCGVSVNHNIVPYNGEGYEKNGEIISIMVVGLILDNCSSADEAVQYLTKNSVTQALVGKVGDFSHFMISDAKKSYVVEWTGNTFHPTEFTNDTNGNFKSAKGTPAIMTNYFVWQAEEYGLGTDTFFRRHPKAAGVERAQVIQKMLPQAKNVEDHLNIAKAVWYKQFCEGKTDWATENAGCYDYDETEGKCWWQLDMEGMPKHWSNTQSVYEAAKELLNSKDMQEYYTDFKTNWSQPLPKNTYWYTQHSVVYDLKALKGYFIMQEGMFSQKVIEFGL